MSNMRPDTPKPFKPVWGLLVILVAFVGLAMLLRLLQPQEAVPWRADLEAAQAESIETGRPLFVYFTATWCGPCEQMRRTTWADADVERALQRYVPVKIDIDRSPEIADSYGVGPIPYFAVLDAGGRPVRQHLGMLSPEDFLAWLGRFN